MDPLGETLGDLRMSEAKSGVEDGKSVSGRSANTSHSGNMSIAESDMTDKEKHIWEAWNRRESSFNKSLFEPSMSGTTTQETSTINNPEHRKQPAA
jgi:hypothetical protein